MLCKYSRSQNQLPLCISSVAQHCPDAISFWHKGPDWPWVYSFDQYLMPDSVLTLDTQIFIPLTRNILIRMQRIYLGYETRKWSLWESKKNPLFCAFFKLPFENWLGLLSLYNDSIPFKVPENPTHLRGQSWNWGEGGVGSCHSPVSSFLFDSAGSRLRIWRLSTIFNT